MDTRVFFNGSDVTDKMTGRWMIRGHCEELLIELNFTVGAWPFRSSEKRWIDSDFLKVGIVYNCGDRNG